MNRKLVRAIWKRAGDHCEYCRMSRFALPLPFQIDHIIAEKHGGTTVESNLALACPHCNRFKGPNIAGLTRSRDNLSGCFIPARTFGWSILSSGEPVLWGVRRSGVPRSMCWP